MRDTAYLYDALGRRLYLTPKEGEVFLRTALGHDRAVRTFCSVLYYTGCRLSEALHLTPRRVDFADQVLVVESLKKRRTGVYRAVPVPPVLFRYARYGARPQRNSEARSQARPGSAAVVLVAYHRVATRGGRDEAGCNL